MQTFPHISRRAFFGLGVAVGLSQFGFAQAAPPWTWTSARNLNTARYNHKAVVLSTGQVLAAGLLDGTTALASAELFNAKSK